MKKVDTINLVHHRNRAESYMTGIKLLGDDIEHYGHCVTLMAIHSAISFTDAVLIGCTGQRSNEADHNAVLKPMLKLCGTRRIEPDGVNHLRWLLSRKTDFVYGDAVVTVKDMRLAKVKAERYQIWVYQCFPELKDESHSNH